MTDYSLHSNVNIRHLRAAVTVAARQSFSAAAVELNVAASALTETIKQLERDIGVQIFDRTTRRVEVTELGGAFIADATRVLAGFEMCLADIRAVGGLAKGRVRVAAAPSMMTHVVIPAVRALRAAHPNIEIRLQDENAEAVARLVLEGAADIGVAGRWGQLEELTYERIGSDRYGLVCSLEHPFAGRASINLSDIGDEPIVALASQTGIRNALEAQSALPSTLWSSTIEASSTLTLTMLLKQNAGIAIMPELAAQLPAMGTLAFVPIADIDMERELYIIRRRQHSLAPAAERLEAEIRGAAEKGPFSAQDAC